MTDSRAFAAHPTEQATGGHPDHHKDGCLERHPGGRSEPHVERVRLVHGAGGRQSVALLRDVIIPALHGAVLNRSRPRQVPMDDAGVFAADGSDFLLTTDAFVDRPLHFAGGNIGTLAVNGTVNDIAMMGGDPLAVALALIVEEGLPIADLRAVAEEVGAASRRAGVPVITGDTKVVRRGAAAGLFVTTTAVGRRLPNGGPSASRIGPGDVVLLSGPVGRHELAIRNAVSKTGCRGDVMSDTRALHRMVRTMIRVGGMDVHAMRDVTRGGLAAALNRIAHAAEVGVAIQSASIGVPPEVAAGCERLGLDPFNLCSEGRMLAFVARRSATAVLAAMRAQSEGVDAVRIGTVVEPHVRADGGRVFLLATDGSHRILDAPVPRPRSD